MRDFTRAQSKQELAFFLLPMICSGMVQQVYSLINTAVVGRYLSYDAVAVIGACQPYASMQGFVCVGMTTGFGFYLFRCIGTGDAEIFGRGFCGALYLTGFLALLGIGLPFFPSFLMDLIHIPEKLRPDAAAYLFYLFLDSGFLSLKNLLFCTIQGMGDSRFPGILSMLGVVTHTMLSVFLIAGMKLGVGASALAILINNALLSVCLFLHLVSIGSGHLKLVPAMRIPGSIWLELLKNGLVKSGMMVVIGWGSMMMQREINRLPEEIIAGDAYGDVINNFLMEPLCAYATAAGIITGQNEGKRNAKLIRRFNRYLFGRALFWCVGFLFLGFFSAPRILRILAGDETPRPVIAAGVLLFRFCCIGYPGLCALLIFRSALQSLGEYGILPWLGVTEMAISMVLSRFVVDYGYRVVGFSYMLRWYVPGILALIWYRHALKQREEQWKMDEVREVSEGV